MTTTTIRPLAALSLAWMVSSPTMAAPSCPAVDSARAMLSQAAAEQNARDLKQARPEPQKPSAQKPADKKSSPQKPADQSSQAPPTIEPEPVSAEMQRAAMLVKEADEACQAGQTTEATDKAKAAMALMGR
jgi:hypothetical protein